MRDDAPVIRVNERDLVARQPRYDWFADEVALDFPSLVALAERMRESFLAAEDGVSRDPVPAEVRLTVREAACGRRVQLPLTVPCTCGSCGGRGEVWSEPCPRCEGTGSGLTHRLVHVHVPSGVRDGTRFLFSVSLPHSPATYVQLDVRVA